MKTILFHLLLLVSASAMAGPSNLDIRPVIIHNVSQDFGVTIVLVSGDCNFTDEFAPNHPTTTFRIERIPLIHRRDPNKPPGNIAPKDWLANLTGPMKRGQKAAISCLGAELLRDRHQKIQAVYCNDMGCVPIK